MIRWLMGSWPRGWLREEAPSKYDVGMHKSKVDLFISQFGYNEAAMMHIHCDLALLGVNIHEQNRIF